MKAPIRGRVVFPTKVAPQNETLTIPMRDVEVLVYQPEGADHWVSKVILRAKDVETGEDGYFGSEWTYSMKPTREQIREHVVDMLDHEVRHQLGFDPHKETA